MNTPFENIHNEFEYCTTSDIVEQVDEDGETLFYQRFDNSFYVKCFYNDRHIATFRKVKNIKLNNN